MFVIIIEIDIRSLSFYFIKGLPAFRVCIGKYHTFSRRKKNIRTIIKIKRIPKKNRRRKKNKDTEDHQKYFTQSDVNLGVQIQPENHP